MSTTEPRTLREQRQDAMDLIRKSAAFRERIAADDKKLNREYPGLSTQDWAALKITARNVSPPLSADARCRVTRLLVRNCKHCTTVVKPAGTPTPVD